MFKKKIEDSEKEKKKIKTSIYEKQGVEMVDMSPNPEGWEPVLFDDQGRMLKPEKG